MGADDWIDQALPPRGTGRARGGGRATALGRRGPGPRATWRRASSRCARTSSRPSWDGRSVELTRREFELIQLLASADGQVLQREDIYQRVWGYAMAHGDRSVDVFVRKVRQKLERASPDWRYIHTHFGVGYRFAAVRVGDPQPSDALPAKAAPPDPASVRNCP